MKPLPRSFAHAVVSLTLALSTGACARGALEARREGPAFNRAARQGAEAPAATPLRLVLFSDAHAVGIDPATGQELWRRPVRAFGPPVSVGDAVVVPVYGHRAVALNANTGATLWEHALPGQVLTGLDASERGVIVTALQADPKERKRPREREQARSVVGGMSMHDGRIRWTRPSTALLGVPAARGKAGFVPMGDTVVSVNLRTGRILGSKTTASADIDRVERHGTTLLASDGDALIDLQVGTRYDYEQDDAQLFARVDGIEPGLGHHGGVVFRLLPPPGAGAPRDALFLGRRVLIFVRLDERGRLSRARWVHARMDQREYVDFAAMPDAVLLVRDDGALVRLDRETGRVREELEGVVEPHGAAFVGYATPVEDSEDSVDRDTTVALLQGLIEDPDERLVPAQKLALTLLWRDPRPQVRRTVEDVAAGIVRPDGADATLSLMDHADTLLTQAWGRGDPQTVHALAERLTSKRLRGDALRDAAREAVEAGGAEVYAPLVNLLDQPDLDARDLDHVAMALRDIGAPETIDGAARFVTQYHADPEIVDASKAIYYLAELLAAHAQPDLPEHTTEEASAAANAALGAVVEDEFTVPSLRAFIEAQLAE
ncbi:MAG: PQQ-binding-like beta-propeller repeat protein [Nannocystaceae bacterium]|nr:PQQ-binding-like beta-propeller repeat protein [bacterium]